MEAKTLYKTLIDKSSSYQLLNYFSMPGKRRFYLTPTQTQKNLKWVLLFFTIYI